MNDEIDGMSLDLKAQRLAQLQEIFPEFFSEGRLDLSAVKEVLGDDELATADRYELSWAGKAESRREIQKQTTATLIPDKDASINFDASENIFIEGENLEVLRTLQKAYFGKVKLIYLDPPYNTGKDRFVYPDDYAERLEEYEKRSGQKNGGGYLNKLDLFKKNTKENGQYHSVWLSMMYPRLYLARNLLREDGVILVSIDDNEQAALKLLLDEIFGSENFVGQIVIQTATDNNPTQIATEHEYILCYCKSMRSQDFWARRSEAADLIQEKYDELYKVHGDDVTSIQTNLRKWIRENKEKLPRVTHYDNVDSRGVFHDGDVANTIFGGYEYDVIHPVTGKPCKIPEKGYRFPETTMQEMLKADDILFGTDETTLIKPKIRLANARDSLRSIIYEDGRASTKIVEQLLGRGVFENPKSHTVLKRLIDFTTSDGQIVMDLFAGSGSTAHAVLEMNKESGGHRKFVCVQMPEPTDEKSEAYKAGYETISAICRDRIVKVIEQLGNGKLDFDNGAIDLGFRSYKLSYSNFKQWKSEFHDKEQLIKQIEIFKEPLAKVPQDTFDLLTELLLKSGIPLSARTERKETKSGTPYYFVEDHLLYALDALSDDLLGEIEELKPTTFVTLGNLFTGEKADETMTNWKLQLQESGIEFKLI